MAEQPRDESDEAFREYVDKWGLPIHGPANVEQCQKFGQIFAQIFGAEFAKDILPSGWLEKGVKDPSTEKKGDAE